MKAAGLGANTFQIFSASPRMWKASPRRAEEVRLLREARKRFDLRPLVIHVNYLVNLATRDPLIRKKSIAGFRAELERAAAIGADYVVLHPGNYRGQTLEEGIGAFVEGLEESARGLERSGAMLLLENTVGGGAQIGSRFEELRSIRDRAADVSELPVGYCLDTCHLLAAGFDVSREKGLNDTVARARKVLGMANVRVIHTNDSKTPLGSHVDRHENIGEGYIGENGFRRILAHPALREKPFILETPVEEEDDDRRNLERLKKLCPKSSTTTTRSS